MNTIAAVIITKNEAHRIRQALSSVRSWVDEIIVVDDFSTDDTRGIAAREFGAKVFERHLNQDFAAQRNFGASQATSAWIIQMDADEEVTPHAAQLIRAAISEASDAVAFELLRLNHLAGHPIYHAGAHFYLTRVYRKDMACYNGVIHERLSVQGKIGRIDADVKHYAFLTASQSLEKAFLYGEAEADIYVNDSKGVSRKLIAHELTWKALKRFWKLYVKKQGYKDSTPGLIWCICNVIGPQIKWIKIWEKAEKAGKLIR